MLEPCYITLNDEVALFVDAILILCIENVSVSGILVKLNRSVVGMLTLVVNRSLITSDSHVAELT